MDLLNIEWKYSKSEVASKDRDAEMGLIVTKKLNQIIVPCYLHKRLAKHLVKIHNEQIKQSNSR